MFSLEALPSPGCEGQQWDHCAGSWTLVRMWHWGQGWCWPGSAEAVIWVCCPVLAVVPALISVTAASTSWWGQLRALSQCHQGCSRGHTLSSHCRLHFLYGKEWCFSTAAFSQAWIPEPGLPEVPGTLRNFSRTVRNQSVGSSMHFKVFINESLAKATS